MNDRYVLALNVYPILLCKYSLELFSSGKIKNEIGFVDYPDH